MGRIGSTVFQTNYYRLRDFICWQPMAVGAISRNLVLTLNPKDVNRVSNLDQNNKSVEYEIAATQKPIFQKKANRN